MATKKGSTSKKSKKTTGKKASARKKTSQKATAKRAKKAPAKKKTAKKKTARKKTAKKSAKKAPARKTAKKKTTKKAAKKTAKKSTKKKAVKKAKAVKDAANGARATLKQALKGGGNRKKLTAADRRALKKALAELRDRVVDEITFLSGENLNLSQRDSSGDLSSYSIHMADQGTDNFDREFALNLVSNEQDILYEIDEAVQRLEQKTYGICQECEEPIEKARLEALPFARMCIRCKSEKEKGRTRYRPFGPTISGR